MTADILKRIGKIAFALILIFSGTAASALEIDTELEANRIHVGESTTLSLRISGGSGDIKPLKVPTVRGLDIKYSGMQRSFQFINGKTWKGIVLSFNVTALRKGKYKIPSFLFDMGSVRLKSRPVTLIVTKGTGTVKSGSGPGRIKSMVELSRKKAYVGEPVFLRYYLLSSGLSGVHVEGVEKQPETRGFVINRIAESLEDEVVTEEELELVKSHLYTYSVVPAETGKLQCGGGTVIISMEFGRSFFDMMRKERLLFNREKIEIVPLPSKGRPENFQGNVGSYTIDVDWTGDTLNVFEEKRIAVTVRGKGNILNVSKPLLVGGNKDIRLITEDGKGSASVEGNTLKGEKKFLFTFIPEKAGKMNVGRFTLNFFDPEKEEYRTVESEDLSFDVKGDSSSTSRIQFDRDDEKGAVDFNPIYFIIIILLVGSGIVLVVLWERKRYNLVVGENNSSDEDFETEEKVDKRSMLDEIKSSIRSGDRGTFSRIVEKLLDHAREQKVRGELKGVSEESLVEIRDRLYGHRFGGGELTVDEMNEILEALKGSGIL